MRPTILNKSGKSILLNEREQRIAEVNQKVVNALGFEIDITTLTTIIKKVSEQRFFQVQGGPVAYVPIRVGEGAWSSNLTTYRSFMIGDDFSTGVINLAGQSGRLAQMSTGVDSVTVQVKNWAKEITYSLFDLQQAAKSGNWDLVTSLEESRKKDWDLGVQKIAFLGLAGDSSALGLLNQVGITNDTTTLTVPISQLSSTDLKAFLVAILNKYRANANRAAWPTHFAIPESDYLGLVGQASAEFPIKSTLEVLEDALKVATKNAAFKILPCAYGDAAYNSLGVQRYALYNYDDTSLRMDVPVAYTSTLANSINSFSWQNVGYGQLTGVQAYRPQELYYFSLTLS